MQKKKVDITCEPAMVPHIQKVMAGEYAIDLPDGFEIRSFLDIGANVGAFSIWAKARYPDAEVYAYEPEPENATLFRGNTVELTNVWLMEMAVAAEAGKRQLFRGLNNCGEHSFADHGEQDMTSSVEVNCVAASGMASFDWLKLDCEGAEMEVLPLLDLSQTKVVTLEFHSKDARAGCKEILFKDFQLVGENTNIPATRGVQKWLRKGIARKPLIFMALPRYGGGEPLFEDCLVRAMMTPGQVPIIKRDLIGDSLVQRARNNLAHDFMSSAATHLLFIDTDLIFDRGQIDRLVSHDLPIVAGIYPKKQLPVQWVLNTLKGHDKAEESGLQRILYAGTGFLMIRRDVFERYMAAYPDAWYCPDNGEEGKRKWDFFPTGVYQYSAEQQSDYGFPERRYLSEDWFFCQHCIDMGEEVWADMRVVLKHVGKYVYHDDATICASSEATKNLGETTGSLG